MTIPVTQTLFAPHWCLTVLHAAKQPRNEEQQGALMIAKKITGGLLAATLALGASGTLIIPANANEVGTSVKVSCSVPTDRDAGISTVDVSYPHGGTWQYGTTLWGGCGVVYSNFLHNSRKHSSSVINAHGVYSWSGVKGAGIWATASTSAVCGKVDQAFYDFND